MPVLTQKELAERSKKTKRPKAEQPVKKQIGKSKGAFVLKKYHLLHPENPQYAPLNFEDTIILNGIEYKRKCENGIIKTEEGKLKDFLIKREYILLRTEEL